MSAQFPPPSLAAQVTEPKEEAVARAICCPDGCYMRRRNEMADIAANYPNPWPCVWMNSLRQARAAIATLERLAEEEK